MANTGNTLFSSFEVKEKQNPSTLNNIFPITDEQAEAIFEYLNRWIDKRDKAVIKLIDIRQTNWYPTKVFVDYAKDQNFGYGSEIKQLYRILKNDGLIYPVIAEKSVCQVLDNNNKLTKEEKPCFSIRDGIHRIAIMEDLQRYLVPALVYEHSKKQITRDFGPGFKNIKEFEKWVGRSIKSLYEPKFEDGGYLQSSLFGNWDGSEIMKKKIEEEVIVSVAEQATIDRILNPGPELTILSFGGGQDSWAILLSMIHDKEFRKKYAPNDFVVAMSDTGNEFPYTYKYVLKAIELCDKHGIHFQFITPDQGYHTAGWMNLKDNLRRNKTILGAAMGVKACTMSLKISVVDKYMYAYMCKLYGFEPLPNKKSWQFYKERFQTKARVLIGFAKDEEARLIKSNKSHASLPKWKRENIQYVYPLIEEGWNRAAAQEIIAKYQKDVPPPSNCMICFYQSDQELLWLERNHPEEFYDWVGLEKAKLEKHIEMGKKNYGVYGTITLLQKLEQAKKKYGHWTDEQLWEYKMSHGHCVKSSY